VVRLAFACALCLSWPASASTCYGSSANGRLDGGVQLPASGGNFVAVPLPSTPSNKFGYGLEFDAQGRIPGYRIDFEAMAEHLFQLSLAGRRHGIAIKRVIFDKRLLDRLLSTKPHGAGLRRTIPFMKGEPWIRHDEHYHVDFDLSCRPLSEPSPDPGPWTDGRSDSQARLSTVVDNAMNRHLIWFWLIVETGMRLGNGDLVVVRPVYQRHDRLQQRSSHVG